MNDDSRRRLTGYLGECIHEFEFWNSGVSNICKHCERWFDWNDKDQQELAKQKERTFTSGNDMVALKDRIVETGKWNSFLSFAFNTEEACNTDVAVTYDMDTGTERYYNEYFIAWLLNPTRFCELVDRWLEGKEKK